MSEGIDNTNSNISKSFESFIVDDEEDNGVWYYTWNFGTVGQPEIRKTAIFRHRQSFIH